MQFTVGGEIRFSSVSFINSDFPIATVGILIREYHHFSKGFYMDVHPRYPVRFSVLDCVLPAVINAEAKGAVHLWGEQNRHCAIFRWRLSQLLWLHVLDFHAFEHPGLWALPVGRIVGWLYAFQYLINFISSTVIQPKCPSKKLWNLLRVARNASKQLVNFIIPK